MSAALREPKIGIGTELSVERTVYINNEGRFSLKEKDGYQETKLQFHFEVRDMKNEFISKIILTSIENIPIDKVAFPALWALICQKEGEDPSILSDRIGVVKTIAQDTIGDQTGVRPKRAVHTSGHMSLHLIYT